MKGHHRILPGGGSEIDKLLSLVEAAEALGIKAKTVRKWITQGKFPGVRVGRLWKVKEVDVEEYVEAHTRRVGLQ